MSTYAEYISDSPLSIPSQHISSEDDGCDATEFRCLRSEYTDVREDCSGSVVVDAEAGMDGDSVASSERGRFNASRVGAAQTAKSRIPVFPNSRAVRDMID